MKKLVSPLLALLLIVALVGCGKPAKVNLNPTKYDKPVEVLNGIVSSTNATEKLFKNHHLLKRDQIKNDATLTPAQRKAALTAETERFNTVNEIYGRANKAEREAADVIKQLAVSGGSIQGALDRINQISGIVINELLVSIDDPDIRQSLITVKTSLETLTSILKGLNNGE